MVPAESKTLQESSLLDQKHSETLGRAMCLTSTRNHMLRLHRCSTNSSRVQNEFLRVDPAPRLSAERHGSTQLRGPGQNWKAQTCLFKVSTIADCPFLATKQPRIQGDPTRRVFVNTLAPCLTMPILSIAMPLLLTLVIRSSCLLQSRRWEHGKYSRHAVDFSVPHGFKERNLCPKDHL